MKLRLPDKAAYDKVAALLEPGKRTSYAQVNMCWGWAAGILPSASLPSEGVLRGRAKQPR